MKDQALSFKKALWWSIFWILAALAFNAGIYFWMGKEKALLFFTGYVIERSLSMDNLFVFLLIFKYFKVPDLYQPRVLEWGIIGALVMRFIIILGGSALLNMFQWIFYVFGVLIIFTAYRMIVDEDKELNHEKNVILRLFKKIMPISSAKVDGHHFFTRENGVLHATPLFVTLLIIESSDLVFAVDSIPAIFAITTDTFIVYTSNVFAILGLRAFYFLLSALMPMFKYLKYGISIVLFFVGVKMLLMEFVHISTAVSLTVVLGVLTASVLVSLLSNSKEPHAAD